MGKSRGKICRVVRFHLSFHLPSRQWFHLLVHYVGREGWRRDLLTLTVTHAFDAFLVRKPTKVLLPLRFSPFFFFSFMILKGWIHLCLDPPYGVNSLFAAFFCNKSGSLQKERAMHSEEVWSAEP